MTQYPSKDLAYYLTLQYTIVFLPQGDDGWAAVIPDLPGCIAAADTIEETMQLLQEGRQAWMESRFDNGHPIPEPTLTFEPDPLRYMCPVNRADRNGAQRKRF